MMGRSHFASGIVAFLATSAQMHYTPVQAAIGALVVSSASLLPDLDHEHATVSNALGPVSRGVSKGIAALAGGHRKGTHCLIGIGLLGVIAQGCVMNRHGLLGMAVLSGILIVTLAAGVQMFQPHAPPRRQRPTPAQQDRQRRWRIQTWIGDLAPIPVVIAGVCLSNVDLTTVPVALVIGCLAHVLGDCLTNSGCPIFWPLSNARLKFGLFKTGGKFETWVVFPALILAAYGLAGWQVWATIT
jgi:membrane-bound metal-dependent hydrolase YbcI (DUF457 family)